MIYNYSTFEGKNPTLLLGYLLSTIPKSLKPQRNFPNFYITDTTFHSHCLSNSKLNSMGFVDWEKEEKEFRDWTPDSWAYTMLNHTKGDVYLALKFRLGDFVEDEALNICKNSIEGVIFHEIGHQFWDQLGKNKIHDEEYDEKIADIYASACLLNLFQKNPDYKGHYEPFPDKQLNIIKAHLREKIPTKDLLEKGELVLAEYGRI